MCYVNGLDFKEHLLVQELAKPFKTTKSKKQSLLDIYATTELFYVSIQMDRTDLSTDRSDFFQFG